MTKEAEELRWEHEVLQQKYNEVSRERDEIQVHKQSAGTLIKNKIKFSSCIRKFRREQLQSRFLILYMRKCANFLSYMRRPLVIYMYDFAIAPF